MNKTSDAPVKLRYDGSYSFMPGNPRQYTVMSHFIDANGCDRYKGSFMLETLVELGIIRSKDSIC